MPVLILSDAKRELSKKEAVELRNKVYKAGLERKDFKLQQAALQLTLLIRCCKSRDIPINGDLLLKVLEFILK